MESAITLTIGVPTYNRRDTVSARVVEFIDAGFPENVQLLVIDNDSPDGTYPALASVSSHPRVTVLKNATNVGYAGNILRLIDEASTDYLVIVSDEDRVDAAGLAALLAHCAANRPVLVSPRARTADDDCYRGRYETRPIAAREFESASFYISGLTFATAPAKEYAGLLRTMIPENSAATVYPQVVLTAMAVASGRAFFLDALVSWQADTLPTSIADPSASRYNGVAGRWSQFLGYQAFFDDRISARPAPERDHYAAMREETRRMLHPLLIDAARREAPGSERYLKQPLPARLATKAGFAVRRLRALRRRRRGST